MRINITHVAKEANVSTVTASRAFSNPELLAPKTHSRVLQAASRLGYVPNRLARSLRKGKTHTIAVLTSDLQQRLNTFKLDLLQREIAMQGYQTLLLQYGGGETHPFTLLSEYRDMVDGVVLCCLEAGPSLQEISALMETGVPILSLEYCSGLKVDVVTADREYGAFLAVTHLYQLGHRRIAFAQIALKGESMERRQQGYRQTMERLGLEPLVSTYPSGNTSFFEDGYQLIHAAREQGVCPTAWIFSDDEVAVGAMRAFQEWGWRVPEDVAVIGWDDVPLCNYVHPQLTSVTQPIQETVACLTARLLRRLQGEVFPTEVTLIRPTLVVRESCGGIPSG